MSYPPEPLSALLLVFKQQPYAASPAGSYLCIDTAWQCFCYRRLPLGQSSQQLISLGWGEVGVVLSCCCGLALPFGGLARQNGQQRHATSAQSPVDLCTTLYEGGEEPAGTAYTAAAAEATVRYRLQSCSCQTFTHTSDCFEYQVDAASAD